MILSLGSGFDASSVVHTLGRATFKGRSVLQDNKFDHVTVLMPANDFTLARKMQEYLNDLIRRSIRGDKFVDAVTGANEKFPDSVNFIRHTDRRVGGGDLFKEYVNIDDAGKHNLFADEEQKRKMFWKSKDAQILLRSFARLVQNGTSLIRSDHIVRDLASTRHRNMKKRTITNLLNRFASEKLIFKERRNEGFWYRLPRRVERLVQFMNPEMGEIPDYHNIDSSSSCNSDEDSQDSDDSSSVSSDSLCDSNYVPSQSSSSDDEESVSMSSDSPNDCNGCSTDEREDFSNDSSGHSNDISSDSDDSSSDCSNDSCQQSNSKKRRV